VLLWLLNPTIFKYFYQQQFLYFNSTERNTFELFLENKIMSKYNRPSGAKHHVVSIAKFATGKAAFNLKRKEVEEQKRNQKSKVLREYAKLCKAEGIVSDRVNLESHQKGQKHSKDQED
jgi:hypothetical protein